MRQILSWKVTGFFRIIWFATFPIFKSTEPSLLRGWTCLWVKVKSVKVLSFRMGILKFAPYLVWSLGIETMELRDSSTVKIEFASNLLPEYLNIWSIRTKVRPYINRVRKCYNCFRWGHSSVFCKGKEIWFRCGEDHRSDSCSSDEFCCVSFVVVKDSHLTILLMYLVPFSINTK